MPIIHSYPTATPTVNDTLIGTKYIENQQSSTNSFNIGAIAQLVSNIIPGSLPSYGQLYLPTGIYYVPIAAINVWQPLGLVATLVSPSPGFSLGTVNKCAFKNISGSAKTVNVFCEIFLNTYGQAFNVDSVAIVLNGNVLQNTATPIQGVSTTLNCIIEMQDSDEISIYIRSNVTDNSAVYLFKMNIFQI